MCDGCVCVPSVVLLLTTLFPVIRMRSFFGDLDLCKRLESYCAILVSSLRCLRLRFVLYCFLSQFPKVTPWSLWVQGLGIHSICCSSFTQVDSGFTGPRCCALHHISNYFPRNLFAATSMQTKSSFTSPKPLPNWFIPATTSKSCWAWGSY